MKAISMFVTLFLFIPSVSLAESFGSEKKMTSSEDMRSTLNQLCKDKERATRPTPSYTDDKSFTKAAPEHTEFPIYKPFVPRGAPVDRVAAGTRGSHNHECPLLCVLTPDHTGRTFQKQPSLYYFIGSSVKGSIELTIIENDEKVIDPLLETRIPSPKGPGIHTIHLADYNVALKKNVPYRWHISIINDPDSRAKDTLAWGRIERVDCSGELQVTIRDGSRSRLPHIYAEAGFWYDAFAEISNQIELNPGDSNLRKQRAGLLDQIELGQVAQFEMDGMRNF